MFDVFTFSCLASCFDLGLLILILLPCIFRSWLLRGNDGRFRGCLCDPYNVCFWMITHGLFIHGYSVCVRDWSGGRDFTFIQRLFKNSPSGCEQFVIYIQWKILEFLKIQSNELIMKDKVLSKWTRHNTKCLKLNDRARTKKNHKNKCRHYRSKGSINLLSPLRW